MRLLTRSYVSEMIRDQFKVTNKQINIDFIKRKYSIVPYKKEGKTALYKLEDLISIGLKFEDFLEGYYPIPHYKEKYWINKESDIININNGKIVTDKKLDKLVSEVTTQVIEVEFDKAVNEELFAKLSDLINYRNTQGNVWELTFETEVDMRSALFDFAHDNGLKTLQISLKSKNLEEIFREKTKK